MSVINQALKDLQKRQQTPSTGRARSVYQAPQHRGFGLWLGVGAGVLGGMLISYLMIAKATADPALEKVTVESVPTLERAEPEMPVTPEVVVVPDVVTEIVHEPILELTPEPIPVTVPEQQETEPTAVEEPQIVQQEAEPEEEQRGSMRVERVERSANELAEQRLAQAIVAIDNGQGRRGETLLQEALILRPDYTDARQRLAAYYYGRGFSNEALSVLQEGVALSPNNAALVALMARIYEETNRPNDALRILNRMHMQLPEHSDLLVLRAAMANELGHFSSAAEDYRALLNVNPNQGIWWLGLGYAEEQQGDTAAAALAYQQALDDPQLDRESRDYVRKRMEALNAW